MKNLYKYTLPSDKPELLSLRGHQPDVLRLFEDILHNGADLRVRVTGRSMVPFLKGGEVLTLRQTPALHLKKGDLILFRNRYGLPVLHRIISKRESKEGTFSFVTKGDALRSFDEEIHESNVLGKALQIEKPLQTGKTRRIDMNSVYYRCINFSVAVFGLLRTQTYFLLSGEKTNTL